MTTYLIGEAMTTITTAAELDALPHLSVVLADKEGRACQRDTTFSPSRWWATGTTVTLDDEDMLGFLPLTVLYRPDQPEPVKPSREAVAAAMNAADVRFATAEHIANAGVGPDPGSWWEAMADAVLALLPGRCAPTVEEVRDAIAAAYPTTAKARAVLALFAAQPTVREAKEAGWDDAISEAADALDSGCPIYDIGNPYRSEANHG